MLDIHPCRSTGTHSLRIGRGSRRDHRRRRRALRRAERRIAGVSGILGGLARPQAGDVSLAYRFVAGLVAAPLALLAALPEIRVDASFPALVAAGLLVGIGTPTAEDAPAATACAASRERRRARSRRPSRSWPRASRPCTPRAT